MPTTWTWPIRALSIAVSALLAASISLAIARSLPDQAVNTDTLRLVSAAPAAVERAGSLQFDMGLRISVSGRTLSETGSGTFDVTNQRGIGTFALPDGLGNAALVQGGRWLYVRVRSQQLSMTQGKHWVGIHLSSVGDTSALGGSDLLARLRLLAGADHVSVVGQDDVAGVPTTRYHVEVDVAKAVAQIPPQLRTGSAGDLQAAGVTTLPLDIWIDSSGLPRKLSEHLTIHGVTLDMTMTMSRYGRHVHVAIPRSSDVLTVANVTEALQDAIGTP